MALARRVLLRQGDVGPDWTRVAVPKTSSTLDCPSFDPDFSHFTITGESQALFTYRDFDQILSTSEVYRSRAQAVGDFELGVQPGLTRCLRGVLVRTLKASTGTFKIRAASARQVRAPKIGERAASYRLTASIAASGIGVHIYMDVLVFQRRRTQAGLFFTGVDSPVPSQLSYARAVDARMR